MAEEKSKKIGNDGWGAILTIAVLSFIFGILICDILDLNFITTTKQGGLPQQVATTTTTSITTTTVMKTTGTLISLSDKRCAECDTSRIVAQLKTLFPSITVKNVDYNTDEGKKLYNDLKLKYLPALLFEDSIKLEDNYREIQPYLDSVGKYYSLRIGASFDPTAEICDNGIDDDNNGLVDCNDPGCNKTLVCRKEITKGLDLFIMSQCPYGVMALNAMKEVLENFKDNIDFRIHYIATENPDGTFRSLHGQPEVDENIRELCAMKYYPENYKYMDYIWCRNKDIQSTSWESCSNETGMDVSKIKGCFEGAEGKKLLSGDIKIAEELDIGASPTWIANNKNMFSGIDAETIKTNYCKSNPNLAGCGKTLSSSSNSPTGGCGA